jgi:uracil-DNA glycosylase
MAFADQLHPNWHHLLGEKINLLNGIEKSLLGEEYLPATGNVLKALSYDPLSAKVLILGQDPYPNREDAMGLAFSSARSDGKLPASLKNIFQELSTDLEIPIPESGDLAPWCDQGVVLLNRVLTCRVGESDSHSKLGWRDFTYEVVRALAGLNVVAILWGKSAQDFSLLFSDDHLITSVHPSPLSAYRGFFGSKPFSKANQLLIQSGRTPVDWSLN